MSLTGREFSTVGMFSRTGVYVSLFNVSDDRN